MSSLFGVVWVEIRDCIGFILGLVMGLILGL